MPQFDPEVFSPQLIWLAITFVILYVLMARIALPHVGEVIEARQNRIEHDLEGAASFKANAEAVLAEYEKAMADARAKAQALLAENAERCAAEATERQEQLDVRLAQRLQEAEAGIARSRQAALKSIAAVAGDIARTVTEKLIGETVDDKAVKAAVKFAAKRGT